MKPIECCLWDSSFGCRRLRFHWAWWFDSQAMAARLYQCQRLPFAVANPSARSQLPLSIDICRQDLSRDSAAQCAVTPLELMD